MTKQIATVLVCVLMIFSIFSIAADGQPWPQVHFYVVSDLHYLAPELFDQDSEAFTAFMNTNDNKMVSDGHELLEVFIEEALAAEEKPDFVLISGDLTMNGEKVSHQRLAGGLYLLEQQGIAVYVIPGNHDIMNPYAAQFFGRSYEKIEPVVPDDFISIYADFGYNESLYKDPYSLSYVVEPMPGLWLLCIDSNAYGQNYDNGYPWPYGSVSNRTFSWVKEMLDRAIEENKKTLAMLHHPVVDSTGAGSDSYMAQTIQNADQLAELLVQASVPVVFSGHTHSISITAQESDDGTLFDIGSGSLPVYPHSYREVSINEHAVLTVATREIIDLPSYHERGIQFSQYSKELAVYGRVDGNVEYLKSSLKITHAEAYAMAEYLGLLGVNYMGGADAFAEELINHHGADLWRQNANSRLGMIVELMSSDPPPGDERAVIYLD